MHEAVSNPSAPVAFNVWRFASGLSGGALMALAAPTILPHIPAALVLALFFDLFSALRAQ